MLNLGDKPLRISAGVLAFILIVALVDLATPDFWWPMWRVGGIFWVGPAIRSLVGSFLGALIGAYISRERFSTVSTFIVLILWITSILVLDRIVAPIAGSQLGQAALDNSLVLVLGLLGALLGSKVGHAIRNKPLSHLDDAA